MAAILFAGSRTLSAQRFTAWVASVIHSQRLRKIASQSAGPPPADSESEILGSEILAADDRNAGHMVGFHLRESYQSIPLRWSRPAAMVELELMRGHKRISIDCAPVREPMPKLKPAFFIDGIPVPDARLSYSEHGAVIALQERPPGRLQLAWVCKPFAAVHDSRRLGLPLTKIAITSD